MNHISDQKLFSTHVFMEALLNAYVLLCYTPSHMTHPEN